MFLNGNEKYISDLVRKNGSKEYRNLRIAYVIQMFVITLFMMFAFGISNTTNENLSGSDMQQLIAILSSVILVSILTIIFFQWILSMQISAIYDVRKQFNKGMYLMGVSKRKLYRIYFFEWIKDQWKCIIAGIIISEGTYVMLAMILQLEERVIPLKLLIISIVLYIILSSAFFALQSSLKLKESFDWKSKKIKHIQIKKNRLIINLVSSILIFILVTIAGKSIESRQIREIVKAFYIISVLVLYNPVIIFLHSIVARISLRFHWNDVFLANRIAQGYFKQIKVAAMFIVLSGTLFIGLNTMYNMVRESGALIAEENVRYRMASIYPDLKEKERENENKYFYTLNFQGKTERGTNVWMKGIDESYPDMFETINVVPGYEDAMEEVCQNGSNGILFPEFYASSSDVGKEIDVYIDGKANTFKIVGLYYTNDFSRLNCLVNKNYLYDSFEIDRQYYNAVYSLDSSGENSYTETKEDVVENSKKKAVGGTELIEAVTYVLLICAVISILIYYALVSENNKKDIARFRALGIGTVRIKKIYLYNAVIPIMFSCAFLAACVRIFVLRSCYVMLDPYYFDGVTHNELWVEIGVVLLFVFISISAQEFQIRKSTDTEEFMYVLKEE